MATRHHPYRRWQALAASVFAVLIAAPSFSQTLDPSEVTFREGEFTSSATCGACHQEIYDAWSKSSVHAQAMSDINFQSALAGVGPEEQDGCLVCHSPTMVLTQDRAQTLALTQEGVTCDFCHSLKDVDLSAEIPFVLDVGPRKRGPLRDARMAPHETIASPLHSSSLLCASCHEFKNRHGVSVLSTYSDWKAGSYADRGIECQDCHMEVYKADLVVGQTSEEVSRKFINLHQVPGGRSLRQLRRALELTVEDVTTQGGETSVVVTVSNRSAGHKIPGGFANRELRLEVEVLTGERSSLQERVYRQVLIDRDGRPLHEIAALIQSATAVRSDTRLKPEERRKERFLFPPVSKGSVITARILYEVEPTWPGDAGRSIEVWRVRREI